MRGRLRAIALGFCILGLLLTIAATADAEWSPPPPPPPPAPPVGTWVLGPGPTLIPRSKTTVITSGSMETHQDGRNIVGTNLEFTTPRLNYELEDCTVTLPAKFELVGSITATKRRRHGIYNREWVEYWAGDGPVTLRSGNEMFAGHIDFFFPGNEYVNYHGIKYRPQLEVSISEPACGGYKAQLKQG